MRTFEVYVDPGARRGGALDVTCGRERCSGYLGQLAHDRVLVNLGLELVRGVWKRSPLLPAVRPADGRTVAENFDPSVTEELLAHEIPLASIRQPMLFDCPRCGCRNVLSLATLRQHASMEDLLRM
jgi:hypothetical protein